MKNKKFKLSTKDKKIAGVCGGISEYFNFEHSLLVRIGFVVLFLTPSFPALIFYVILWLLAKY
tara:strand:+ start:366 stop:554 length:189 start_codon:yes stop_codon:yes gene_type:complete